jgi:mannose-6-phosphate isomerase-like protein (cupin superfamily)
VHGRDAIRDNDGGVAYRVFRAEDQEFSAPSGGDLSRGILRLSHAMAEMRANVWRYPPGAKGRRHSEHLQEEVFVVLEGTVTIFFDDPAQEVELAAGSVAVVEPGTPSQITNPGDEDAAVFIVGAPPEQGGVDYLPDAG